ncbi:MAG: GreA/GreB family elongation factor [Phycisphaerae bacterium]|jgi:transcription elongation GreA/GreB family factor|nr:GreA/GreB family elongation factor [Phycisphaerae bacterium]
MDLRKIQELTEKNDVDAVEIEWMEAIESGESAQAMCEALKLIVDAKQPDVAVMLASMLLSDASEKQTPAEALDIARLILPTLPANPELRTATAKLYKQVYAQVEHFDLFMDESGLESNQAPRRAIRTLDTCLALTPGTPLAGRYEQDVLRVDGFNSLTGCFDLTEPGGRQISLEPKPLADNYEPVEDGDFRVLRAFRPDDLIELVANDPTAVMIGVCRMNGGQVDSLELKDAISPRYLPPKKWSNWWTKAKTAVKRSPFLTIEGRNPTFIIYHAEGHSLEQELAASVEAARVPLELLEVLKQYVRELKLRKLETDPTFVSPILDTLAKQADSFRKRRAADALTASLAIGIAQTLGLGEVETPYPSPSELLSEAKAPAKAVLALTDPSLRNNALVALAEREDAAEQLAEVLTLLSANELDLVDAKLRDAGRQELVEHAVDEAMRRPVANPQICIWLWQGPSQPLKNAPNLLDLFSRLMKIMQEMHRDPDLDRTLRRETCGQIRSTLTAGACKTFRKTISKLDEGVAATVKRKIEVNPGLSEASRETLLNVVRDEFYALFIQAKVASWLDDGAIWTTKESIDRLESELKELVDVALPANSRAIGEAAALGDLSENAEWQYAVEEQRRLNGRVAQMQNDLMKARALSHGDVPSDTVGIGSKITVRRVSDQHETELTILGPWESNVELNVFSYRTPLALELLGKGIGDTATLKLDGSAQEYSIAGLDAII